MSIDGLGKTCSFDVCQNCRVSCCQDAKPPLTHRRIKEIEKFLRRNNAAVAHPFENGGYIFPATDKFGFCVFYNRKTKRCKVHEVKPETCVAGPVTFDINCHAGKVEWFLKKDEICALAGQLYQDHKRFRAHFEIARRQILDLISGLDVNSLRVILRIEEPETFKIGDEALPKDVARKLATKQV